MGERLPTRRSFALLVAAAVATSSVALLSTLTSTVAGNQAARSVRTAGAARDPSAGRATCRLSHAAFCATFSHPAKLSNRAGELNGTVWGVSRQIGFSNLGQRQYDAAVISLQMKGTCPTERVTVESDIKICHGQLNEMVNDNPAVNASNQTTESGAGTVTSLAMYPKQPFDFARRTGKVVFDVSDDSGGSHAAWPELWITSTPAPDPFAHLSSWQALPRDGFGFRLDAVCGPGQGGQCGPNCSVSNTTRV